MDLGPHAGFIVAAYAALAVILGGLIAWLFYDGFRQASALAGLEAKGIKRRSATSDGTGK
jgi:heme exporter protein D